MIISSKGIMRLEGSELEIKADLVMIFIELYKKEYNKKDIFECLSICELINEAPERGKNFKNKDESLDDMIEDLKKLL